MPDPRRRSGGRPPRRVRVDPARRAAFDVLRMVRVDDAYTNLALPHVLAERGLSGRDAGFVTELASGTLRRRGTYDAVLTACVDRPLAKVEAKVLDALRLGVHQLLGMRVPDHAAISTTVDLVRDRAGAGPAGFANAVLRRVAEHDLDAWVRRVAPDPDSDPLGYAVVAHSHPRWIVEQLAASLAERAQIPRREGTNPPPRGHKSPGERAAIPELGDLLAADNAPARVTLVARPGRATPDELPGTRGRWSPYAVTLDGGDPGVVPAVAEGRAGVQDEGSQLVALAMAQAPLEGSDERWLDLCAGPGGKAALLAALASERGARMVANEAQPHRADLVRRALDGAEGVEDVTVHDGRRPPWTPGSFDRVLVDAPCTGLGALRRRPEARWRKQPSDLAELVPLQRALLASALDLARPGGVVLYATCSPVLAETRDVVDAVLDARPDVDLETVALEVPDSAGPLPGTVQLWPHRHATDAMFMALLRRR